MPAAWAQAPAHADNKKEDVMSRWFAVVLGYFRTLGLLAFPHSWRGVELGKRSVNKSCLAPLVTCFEKNSYSDPERSERCFW